MKFTRQQMAGAAFALLLVAVVVLQFVPGDDANSLSSRLEGAMGMAFFAFIGESVKNRTPLGPTALLVLCLTGCGASAQEIGAWAKYGRTLLCVETPQPPAAVPDAGVLPISREYPGNIAER